MSYNPRCSVIVALACATAACSSSEQKQAEPAAQQVAKSAESGAAQAAKGLEQMAKLAAMK